MQENGRSSVIMDAVILQVESVWPSVAKVLYVPHDDTEYTHLVAILDQLIDYVGEDEAHPLASLMEVIGSLIEQYEDEHIPMLDAP
jgi:HTH-type transcriptional regulator/antitoxin HigA